MRGGESKREDSGEEKRRRKRERSKVCLEPETGKDGGKGGQSSGYSKKTKEKPRHISARKARTLKEKKKKRTVGKN